MTTDPLHLVSQYHETTKHHPHRYARSLGYLDWATQPSPFRWYDGAPCVPLILAEESASPSYDALHAAAEISPQLLCHATVSEFFQYSLAISAWKQFRGSRWALRVNPSSGNLHPTEGYLVIGETEGLVEVPGVFHYRPKGHVLERRCDMRPDAWHSLTGGFPHATFLAGLSSIHWREAWKYGERAYRYCQHDVGHALAALAMSAAVQGWQAVPLVGVSDATVGGLLGLSRKQDFQDAEPEAPDLLIAIISSTDPVIGGTLRHLPRDALHLVPEGKWYGAANRLSSGHTDWELIDSVAVACTRPSVAEPGNPAETTTSPAPLPVSRSAQPARRIILHRRSAVTMDGHTSMTADQFYHMLDRTLPRFASPPWSSLGPPACVHLGLFVHLVEGLDPGLYILVRSSDRLLNLRESMRREFAWQRPSECPEGLPLYQLMSGDMRVLVGRLCCDQDIASDGVFSVGMIAEFEGLLQTHGAWMYRRLFWETGMIGQVLYLEAEAAGLRGTGIGCFFDDEVHHLLGFENSRYQSLYHFTVGGPVEDSRITTLPPYPPEIIQRTTAAG